MKKKRPPQQEGRQQEKRRLADLLFYHRSAIDETGSTKSSKLAKITQLVDDGGRKRCCFLCGASGTTSENKIEASHIVQLRDIHPNGGWEAMFSLDMLKTWQNLYEWKRPFRIHEAMNLIWLCHTHHLAFDRHEFGLTLNNSVVLFSSYQDEYNLLVIEANQRLVDPAQPLYDMSYVSRRAVGMRICKAQWQNTDYFNFDDQDNLDAWAVVIDLSYAASLKPEEDDDSDDEEEEDI
jgi:HNH endonuclease